MYQLLEQIMVLLVQIQIYEYLYQEYRLEYLYLIILFLLYLLGLIFILFIIFFMAKCLVHIEMM